MSAAILTILTPTWNRGHLLPRLYKSLCEQRVLPGSFEWLVVDDGSDDGTIDWLSSLIPTAPFTIRMIQQKNGGKHRALNSGASQVCSPWTLVVDSDDWLLPGAMKRILDDVSKAPADVLAIIAPLKIDGFGSRNFKLVEHSVDFAEWRLQRQVGDTSDVVRSSLLKQFPFPEFAGETFIAEDSFYSRALKDGGIRLSSKKILGAEYQPDGLSSKSLELRSRSALGALYTYDNLQNAVSDTRLLLRNRLNFHRFYWHATSAGKQPFKYGFRANLFWLVPSWFVYRFDCLILSLRKTYKKESPER